MKLCLIIILLIIAIPVNSQTYLLNKNLIERDRKDFLGCKSEVFNTEKSISYNLGTGDLKSSFSEIEDDIPRSIEYLEKLKDSLSSNPLDFILLRKIGDYYNNVEDKNNSHTYYKRALEQIDISFFDDDSAAFLGARSFLKFELDLPGFIEDAEKALSLNPNETISLSFYPLYLISNREYEKAKTFLINALDNNPPNEAPILFLAFINFIERFEELFAANKDPSLKKELKEKHYEELIDWSPVQKYFSKINHRQTKVNLERLLHFYNLFGKILFFDENDKGKLNFDFSPIEKKQISELKNWLLSSLENKTLNEYTANKCLGFVSLCLQDEDSAIDFYQKALQVFPENKPKTALDPNEVYLILLFIYREFDKSYDYENLLLKKISEQRFKSISDYLNLSKFYILEDQIEKARFYIEEAEKIDSRNFDVCRLKAHIGFVDGTEIILEGFYMDKAFRFIKNDDDAYLFYLQSAIYNMFNNKAIEAYDMLNIINENKENCETCDRLLKTYFKSI